MTRIAASGLALLSSALVALLVTPTIASAEIGDHLTLFGDFRGRYEGFYYDEDGVRDRNRGRYRARVGLGYTINEYFDGVFRIASSNESASRNETFGGNVDFGPDELNIDQAYVRVKPFGEEETPSLGGTVSAMIGKTPNPFRSKIGKDMIIWDGDITPEGASLHYAITPIDILDLNLDAAYYVIDENSDNSDPELAAFQLDTLLRPAENVQLGGSVSYYRYSSLTGVKPGDDDFFTRSGNIPGGLSSGTKMGLVDFRGSAKLAMIERWPILFYGNVVTNTSAQKVAGGGEEDTGWSLGAEVGDKKEYLKFGVAWLSVEANAVPAFYMDADPFDGMTNREGVMIYAEKQIVKNTDIAFQLYGSDRIDDDLDDDEKAERWRLQIDLKVKF